MPIHGVLGDSHAALFAHRCVEPYTAKVTYGTGSSIMMNAGGVRPRESAGVVTSLAWGRRGKAVYCVEGNINYTGAVITWLVEMGLLEKPSLSGSIAASLSGNGGVYLVPAVSGLGAPYFNDKARAAIIGMDLSLIHIFGFYPSIAPPSGFPPFPFPRWKEKGKAPFKKQKRPGPRFAAGTTGTLPSGAPILVRRAN